MYFIRKITEKVRNNFNADKVLIKANDPEAIVINGRRFRGMFEFIKKVAKQGCEWGYVCGAGNENDKCLPCQAYNLLHSEPIQPKPEVKNNYPQYF